MIKITRWRPDVNECEFDLIFEDGNLVATKVLKLDPRLEGLNAEEAYAVTSAECIARGNYLFAAKELLNDEQKNMISVNYDENRELVITTDSEEVKSILENNSFKIKLV